MKGENSRTWLAAASVRMPSPVMGFDHAPDSSLRPCPPRRHASRRHRVARPTIVRSVSLRGSASPPVDHQVAGEHHGVDPRQRAEIAQGIAVEVDEIRGHRV